MGWLRLDAATFDDRALRRTGTNGRMVFLAAIMLSKHRDWIYHDERRGWLPRTEFDGLEVALHWGMPNDATTILGFDEAIRDLASGEHPLFIAAPDGSGWLIANWERYQPDPTSLIRKRRLRVSRWKEAMKDDPQAGNGPKRPSPKRASARDDETEWNAAERSGDPRRDTGTVRNAAHRSQPGSGSTPSADPVDFDAAERDAPGQPSTRRDETGRGRDEDEDEDESRQEGPATPQPRRPNAAPPNGTHRPGVVPRGEYVPEPGPPPDAIPTADGAKRILDALSAAPTKPIRGPDIKPPDDQPATASSADHAAKIARLKAETLRRIAELDAQDKPKSDDASSR